MNGLQGGNAGRNEGRCHSPRERVQSEPKALAETRNLISIIPGFDLQTPHILVSRGVNKNPEIIQLPAH